jgi:hypothetical protein
VDHVNRRPTAAGHTGTWASVCALPGMLPLVTLLAAVAAVILPVTPGLIYPACRSDSDCYDKPLWRCTALGLKYNFSDNVCVQLPPANWDNFTLIPCRLQLMLKARWPRTPCVAVSGTPWGAALAVGEPPFSVLRSARGRHVAVVMCWQSIRGCCP